MITKKNILYPVVRAWGFLNDHSGFSGSISFVRKDICKNVYQSNVPLHSCEIIADVEKGLVTPSLNAGDILLFNKSTIHSARALRPKHGVKPRDYAFHPLNEIKIIQNKEDLNISRCSNIVAREFAAFRADLLT